MGVQQSCDVAEAGKLFSGTVKRSNFDDKGTARFKAQKFQPFKADWQLYESCIQCSEIFHSAHNAFVCSVSFSLNTSWSQ